MKLAKAEMSNDFLTASSKFLWGIPMTNRFYNLKQMSHDTKAEAANHRPIWILMTEKAKKIKIRK